MIASSTEAREYVLVKAAELVEITGEPADPWIIAENIAHELLEQKKKLQGLEENSSRRHRAMIRSEGLLAHEVHV
jgi:hypothetical protein